MNALKTYVFSKGRNTRIAFLVDNDTPIALIKKIMTDNYRIWGGTYNPIIPVHDNVIEKKWVEMLGQIDPDIIYHSPTVNARKLQENGIKVYPRVYITIPENSLLNLPGVNPLTFIDHFFKYNLAERHHVHLPYFNPGFDHILKNLLALNFGVRELSIEDDEYLQVIRKHCIYEGNIEKALSETWSQIGFMQNLLCESYLGNEILQAERWQVEHFELIIYDEDNSFNDLIYYWNRRLYQNPSLKYRQIAVSKAEFEQVANDPFFHNILSHNSGQDHIYVTSRSLTEEELSTIIALCDTTSFRVALKIAPTADFPEKFTKANHFNQQYWIKTLLQANEGFINIREYPIGDHIRLKGNFEIDIRINNSGSWQHSAFRFPYHTLLRKNISDVPARVNSYNALSFQVDSSLRGIDLQLPPIAEMLRSRVQIRDIAGQIKLPQGLKQCPQSDAGLLLSAFMELFNNDWFFVRQFALDKFWLKIFTGTGIYNKIKQVWQLEDRLLSETDDKKFKNNLYGQLEKGDGLFSYKDLQHELKCIYNKYADELAAKGEDLEEGYVVSDKNGFIRGHYQR